jgi:1,4-dihydroxy-2-naphthoyl-CoA hydrolase
MPVGQGIGQGILMPIVHAEADYHGPLRTSQKATVTLTTRTIKRGSYGMDYAIQTEVGAPVATIHTVHAVIDRDWKPRRIPERLRAALEQLTV